MLQTARLFVWGGKQHKTTKIAHFLALFYKINEEIVRTNDADFRAPLCWMVTNVCMSWKRDQLSFTSGRTDTNSKIKCEIHLGYLRRWMTLLVTHSFDNSTIETCKLLTLLGEFCIWNLKYHTKYKTSVFRLNISHHEVKCNNCKISHLHYTIWHYYPITHLALVTANIPIRNLSRIKVRQHVMHIHREKGRDTQYQMRTFENTNQIRDDLCDLSTYHLTLQTTKGIGVLYANQFSLPAKLGSLVAYMDL